nr:Gfo/Idh/MocA family oxidoreductase [Chloroflexota bacterium]
VIVCLQARAAPAILHMKQLVEDGYVGEMLSCSMRLIRGGVLERVSGRTWQRDVELGANTLTIAAGHSIDALRFVAGEFGEVSAIISTQVDQWYETDTDTMRDVTSPDNILVNGRLTNGAVVSVHVAVNPWAGSGYVMEIYGRKGTLVATSDDSPQIGDVFLQGAQGNDKLEDIEVPASLTNVLEGMPSGSPQNVGQMYYQFGEAIRGNASNYPDFETAVDMHKLIDTIRLAAGESRTVATTG